VNPIDVFDLKRMFIGDAPPLFLLEIVVRTVLMYGYALFMLRLMGRRSMGQLSPFDFAIVIALGSAVGDPMFYPEVPLLHGFVVIIVIVLVERGLAELVQRSEKAETVISGKPILLLQDGRLEASATNGDGLSKEELFTILRTKEVRQLGEVQRAYLEQSGQVSVFLFESGLTRPGLPTVPPWELEAPGKFKVGEIVSDAGTYACAECGAIEALAEGVVFPMCLRCDADQWVRAAGEPSAS
jgi:uncharacterized membrane protein YcaP (DUF421 family)